MKSLDTNLLSDGKVVNTRHQFITYQVEEVRGDWYWLVAYQGTRAGSGWDFIAHQPGTPVPAADPFRTAIPSGRTSCRAVAVGREPELDARGEVE